MTPEKFRRILQRWTIKDFAEALAGTFGKFYPREIAIIREEQELILCKARRINENS